MTIDQNELFLALGEVIVAANKELVDKQATETEQATGDFVTLQDGLSAFLTSNIQHRNKIAKRVS